MEEQVLAEDQEEAALPLPEAVKSRMVEMLQPEVRNKVPLVLSKIPQAAKQNNLKKSLRVTKHHLQMLPLQMDLLQKLLLRMLPPLKLPLQVQVGMENVPPVKPQLRKVQVMEVLVEPLEV